MQYPRYLTFASPQLHSFALQLQPYAQAFFEGGILTLPESEGWENVFFHCLSEALTADIFAEELRMDPTQRKCFVAAAFLHDAYKRREVEKILAQPDHTSLLYETDAEATEWLRDQGYNEGTLALHASFGNNAALQIYKGEMTDLPARILHYIDDITDGDQIISLEERLSMLEKNPKYILQNEASRERFNGKTLYQAKREINRKTENELRILLAVDGSLTDWINTKRTKRLIADLDC